MPLYLTSKNCNGASHTQEFQYKLGLLAHNSQIPLACAGCCALFVFIMPGETQVQSKKWADDSDDEEAVGIVETPVEDGIKTITEVKINAKGQKVKVIRKIRVYTRTVRHNKNVEARKKWKKFGECANAGPGLEDGITSESTEEIFLVLGAKQASEEVSDKPVVSATAVCRTCGKVGDHWTTKCPLRAVSGKDADSEESNVNKPPEKSGKYIPPSQRAGATASTDTGSGSSRRGDEFPTVRVTNLSEETRDSDLAELFRPFGPIARIYLAKDKETNESRGFAFVSFMRKEDAARAIAKLSGHGYDHLILHLEWAKPSK